MDSDQSFWNVLLAADVGLLAVLLIALPFLDPSSGAFVVSMASLALLLVTLVGLSVIRYVGWTPFAA